MQLSKRQMEAIGRLCPHSGAETDHRLTGTDEPLLTGLAAGQCLALTQVVTDTLHPSAGVS